MITDKITESLIRKIEEERTRQHIQWGGPHHDDGHSSRDWCRFINKQSDLACSEVKEGEFCDRMVKIAALAIAAVESEIRKKNKERSERLRGVIKGVGN